LVFFVIIAPNGLIGLWQQYFGRKASEENTEVQKTAVKTS
jgi:hypothetical protein